MRLLKDASIKRKLTLVNLLAASAALLVAGGALFAFQLITFRQTYTHDLSALASIIASHSTAAVVFNDKRAAAQMLAALKAKPHIVQAQICLQDGAVLAEYGPSGALNETTVISPTPEVRFAGGYLWHAEPIILDGEILGVLRLRSNYAHEFWTLARRYAEILAVVLSFSILLTLLLSARLQRVISSPILSLAATAKRIADHKDYSVRVPVREHDEIGTFSEAFNQMIEQIQAQDVALQSARDKLACQVKVLEHEISERTKAQGAVQASRFAGMAEIATNVLHNVGNVLNSVNVATQLIRERLRHSRVPQLRKTALLVQEHAADLGTFLAEDPKGKLIPGYLVQLASHLETDQQFLAQEVGQLSTNVDHIKEIVAMQQSYAHVAGVIEPLPVSELIEDALRMNAGAFAHHGITVDCQFQAVPPVLVDKHKVLQILVNLLLNAKYALEVAHPAHKQLTISVTRQDEERVQVTVRDNGIGISPEDLTRVFQHGFTTKKHGHGFGLHSGVLAAKEMGGALHAASPGLNQGATFTLELPIAKTPPALQAA